MRPTGFPGEMSYFSTCTAISRRQALASLCAMPVLLTNAAAQTAWPTQAVRILLGQPAGSGSDPLARGLSPHLAAAFGQPFVVENMPGSGGSLLRPQ